MLECFNLTFSPASKSAFYRAGVGHPSPGKTGGLDLGGAGMG
jgi:hypothetical protein